MAQRRIRTYKLRLSKDGFDRFLDAHHRLARLIGEMIPYGMTLYVALHTLAETPAGAWLDSADESLAGQWRGDRTYYVGYSCRVAELTARILEARVADGRAALPISLLYVLAVRSLDFLDDGELYDVSGRAIALVKACD